MTAHNDRRHDGRTSTAVTQTQDPATTSRSKAATKPEIEHVDIGSIKVRVRRRRLDDKKVEGLAESIWEVGSQTPVTADREPDPATSTHRSDAPTVATLEMPAHFENTYDMVAWAKAHHLDLKLDPMHFPSLLRERIEREVNAVNKRNREAANVVLANNFTPISVRHRTRRPVEDIPAS